MTFGITMDLKQKKINLKKTRQPEKICVFEDFQLFFTITLFLNTNLFNYPLLISIKTKHYLT